VFIDAASRADTRSPRTQPGDGSRFDELADHRARWEPLVAWASRRHVDRAAANDGEPEVRESRCAPADARQRDPIEFMPSHTPRFGAEIAGPILGGSDVELA
jgi:hypothetical protein